MFTRITRVATSAALLAALAASSGIGWAQDKILVPPKTVPPVPPAVTETMLLVYDPLVLEQLVRIEAVLEQLAGAVKTPPQPTSPPTLLPSAPPVEVPPKK